MKIVIAGGSGFLGQALEKYFAPDHDVIILTRRPLKNNHVPWDGHTVGEWVEVLEGSDVLMNLAGKSVDCRYTEVNKAAVMSSRVNSTAILEEALGHVKHKPFVWLNASSATIYVHSVSHDMTERSGITGDDFSMTVCKNWEKTFFKKSDPRIRKVALRSSIVLGNESDAFRKLKMLSRFGLGGKLGNGKQYFSWIHVNDFCKAVEFIIQHKNLSGAINITSPNPIPNTTFMKALGRHSLLPFQIPAPEFLLSAATWIMRTEKELILKSRRVVPHILLQSGFAFRYPHIEQAFDELFSKS